MNALTPAHLGVPPPASQAQTDHPLPLKEL